MAVKKIVGAEIGWVVAVIAFLAELLVFGMIEVKTAVGVLFAQIE